MTVLYKLLYDLALYYVLSGQYIFLLTGLSPSPLCFGLLALSAALCCLIRHYLPGKRLLLVPALLVPLLALTADLPIHLLLQAAPAMLYLIWCESSGRLYTNDTAFRYHFFSGLWLLLALLPSFIIDSERFVDGLTVVLPYFILQLALGICLLRILREKKPSSLRQTLIMIGFLAGCLAFVLLGIPRLLGQGAAFLWQHLLRYVLALGGYLLGGVIMVVFWIISWVFRFLNLDGKGGDLTMGVASIVDDSGVEEVIEEVTHDTKLLELLLFIFVLGAIAGLLMILFKHMSGEVKPSTLAKFRQEVLSPDYVPTVKHFRAGLLRPTDPRLALRYYLQKFLKESKQRGAELKSSMTAEDIYRACAPYFPRAPLREMLSLYVPARYCLRTEVSRADADRAQALWKELKRSEEP